jgi:hypothetical protein
VQFGISALEIKTDRVGIQRHHLLNIGPVQPVQRGGTTVAGEGIERGHHIGSLHRAAIGKTRQRIEVKAHRQLVRRQLHVVGQQAIAAVGLVLAAYPQGFQCQRFDAVGLIPLERERIERVKAALRRQHQPPALGGIGLT